MQDPTTPIRQLMTAATNLAVQSDDPAQERVRLEGIHGQGNVWNTSELQERFEVIGFAAPFCVVRERTTGTKGSVQFQHSPRFYFGFEPA